MQIANIANLFNGVRRTATPQPGGSTPTPPPPPSSSGTNGEVILTNRAGPVTPNVPVATGIPIPRGHVASLPNFQLVDPTTEVQRDAQFDTLTNWEDGSIKHVQVSFLADVGASDTTYKLKYGPSVSRTPVTNAVSVSQNSGITTVSHPTGITVVIDAKGSITSIARGGQTIINDGYCGMVEAAVAAREFLSSASTTAVVTVEESGPIRAVIRVRGTFRSSGGVDYIQYVFRWYITRDTLDWDHTFVDETSTANENNGVPLTLSHASRKVFFRFTYAVDGTPQYRIGGESGAMYSGNVTGEHHIHQVGSYPWTLGSGVPAPGHTFSYTGVGTGTYAPGILNLQGSTGTRRVGIFVKDMWQNYPMELNVNANTVELRYFSRRDLSTFDTSAPSNPHFVSNVYTRPNSFYMRSSGIGKTYRGRMSFHTSARSDAELHQENDLFQRNYLECKAPLTWYQDSLAHGELTTVDSTANTGIYAWFARSNIQINITAMAPTQSGGQSGSSTSAGGGTNFGWRDYGDRARVDSDAPHFQQDTHIGGFKHLQAYLMTGDERFWQMGFIAGQHYYDIDIRHNPCIPYAGYGAPNSNAPAGGTRYAGHTVLDHEGDHDFSEHYHVSAMPELYMLTGDRRAKDVLIETANWIKYITTYTHKLPFNLTDKYRESDRYYGYPILGMVQANRVLNDYTYHQAIANCVNYMIGWIKTDSPHFGWDPAGGGGAGAIVNATSSPSALNWPLGTPINTNSFTSGTGVWACQRSDNSYSGVTTGTSPWFSMPTLEAISQFRDAELQWIAAGYAPTVVMADLNMMMFQEMKYLLVYCYEDAINRFAYSEVARSTNGFSTPGDSAGSVHNTLGASVMLYIEKLYEDELAAGRISNPEWFTASLGTKLPALNQLFADMMRNVSATANSQPYSPYGYEHPFNSYIKRAKQMGYMPA